MSCVAYSRFSSARRMVKRSGLVVEMVLRIGLLVAKVSPWELSRSSLGRRPLLYCTGVSWPAALRIR